MPTNYTEKLQLATSHLLHHDPILKPIILKHGDCDITPNTDYYAALVRSIVGQQLSVKAAAVIIGRFRGLYNDQFPTPEQILETSVEELRAIGLSNAKGRYVRDLAQHVLDGRLHLTRLSRATNEQIIAELTAVKGIGEWTSHMFLLFSVGRLDVLPTGDLGIRNGIRALYGLSEAPTPEEVRAVAARYQWHPYESVASWYIWRSLDNSPK